ncbi:MAG: HAD family phosphatase [Lentisphaerae bacterium]|nr:HAD family phosphatase [Lentisphaerota bacterium]
MGIRLIATDLDGTLIGRTSEFERFEQFRDTVDRIRGAEDGCWAVCTGRSLRNFRHFFEPMAAVDAMPDFVIVKHAFIYGARRFGFTPHVFWNLRTLLEIRRDRALMRRALKEWESKVKRRFRRARTLTRNKEGVCLRLDTDECAAAAVEMLEKNRVNCRHLRVFRYGREVDVRAVPFTKGLAVSELARHLGIARSDVLAIGDGHNDISMLDGSAAGMTGCPANSEPEVTEVVHRSGGHIASARALAGVLEVVEAHLTGQVRSALPPTWRDPVNGANPRNHRRVHSPLRRRRRIVRNVLLGGAAVATVLALASLGLVPFSNQIMAPFEALARALERIFDLRYR